MISMFILCSTISAAGSGRLGARTNFPPHIGVNEGNGMGYLKLVILVLAYALIPPALAQTCCPAGCAPEADRYVTTGPLWTRCIPIACADGSRKPSGDSAAGPTREHRKSAVLARPLRTARSGPTSDSPGVPIDESDQSTGRRGDQSMRESVDRKCAVVGLLFRGRCRQGRRQKNWPGLP